MTQPATKDTTARTIQSVTKMTPPTTLGRIPQATLNGHIGKAMQTQARTNTNRRVYVVAEKVLTELRGAITEIRR